MSANATTFQKDGRVMMIKASSLFGQILSEIFSSVDFEKLVFNHGAGRHTKGFRCKAPLISMLFRHLA